MNRTACSVSIAHKRSWREKSAFLKFIVYRKHILSVSGKFRVEHGKVFLFDVNKHTKEHAERVRERTKKKTNYEIRAGK